MGIGKVAVATLAGGLAATALYIGYALTKPPLMVTPSTGGKQPAQPSQPGQITLPGGITIGPGQPAIPGTTGGIGGSLGPGTPPQPQNNLQYERYSGPYPTKEQAEAVLLGSVAVFSIAFLIEQKNLKVEQGIIDGLWYIVDVNKPVSGFSFVG